jgi:hypothetical protein
VTQTPLTNQYTSSWFENTISEYAAECLVRTAAQKSVAGLFCNQSCMRGKPNTVSFKALKDGYRSKDSFPNISSKFSSDTANTKSVHVSWNNNKLLSQQKRKLSYQALEYFSTSQQRIISSDLCVFETIYNCSFHVLNQHQFLIWE